MASTPPPAGPPPIGAALREAKRVLRERALAARDALLPAARAAAATAIAGRLIALASYGAARTILITVPFRSEWDSRLLARHALDAGKTVVSPRVDPGARMLALYRVADIDTDVAPGYRDIPEPLAHCPAVAFEAIDWVLVPGVAFDVAGRRLGYGGGYYDRLLPLLTRHPPRITGAFEAQIVAEVPCGPHDLVVDCLVTETRIIDTTAAREGG